MQQIVREHQAYPPKIVASVTSWELWKTLKGKDLTDQCDLVELRVDALPPELTTEQVMEFRPEMPLLVTVRCHEEGGLRRIPEEERFALLRAYMPYAAAMDISSNLHSRPAWPRTSRQEYSFSPSPRDRSPSWEWGPWAPSPACFTLNWAPAWYTATWEKRKRPPGNGTSHSLRKPSAASAPFSADYGAFPHMNIITSAFLAARPKTLTASLIPVWAGCMVVQKLTGSWNASLALLTLASCLCLQIACNFFNDAIDHAKHADTEQRTGPVRMTASGALSHGTVMLIGLFFLLGACLLAFPLIELRGWPILAIGIPSLYFTYGYTGGPWPLAYKGLGEIFVILFFGLVAVLGTILVQIGTAPVVPGTLVESLAVYNAGIVTGIQCGLLCAVMISVNNIRDRKEDLTTGKRTLAVRLGEGKARAMAQSFILAAYITLPTSSRALHLDLSHTWWMWIPSILFGGYLMLLIRKTPADSRMNRVLALSSLHLLLYLATYTILPTR